MLIILAGRLLLLLFIAYCMERKVIESRKGSLGSRLDFGCNTDLVIVCRFRFSVLGWATWTDV